MLGARRDQAFHYPITLGPQGERATVFSDMLKQCGSHELEL